MTVDTAFEGIWRRFDDFTFKANQTDDEQEQIKLLCEYAHRFKLGAQEICQPAFQQPSHVTVNQALVQLTKKYWEWYYVVPKRHRNQVGDRKGHLCIHFVFKDFFERLKRLDLGLAPPMLFVPVPVPPPPAPIYKIYKVDGFPIGDIEEEEEAEDEEE